MHRIGAMRGPSPCILLIRALNDRPAKVVAAIISEQSPAAASRCVAGLAQQPPVMAKNTVSTANTCTSTVVIKIGSNALLDRQGGLDESLLRGFAAQLASICD